MPGAVHTIRPLHVFFQYHKMDLLKCLFNRPLLEDVARQFKAEAEGIVASGNAHAIIYEDCGAKDEPSAAAPAALKPQTINEFRKSRVEMTESSIQLGRLFSADPSGDEMWVLQYKFFTIMYVSDSLMALVQQGSPKAVSDGFLRYFRSYFERHLCGVGSASKKKGVLKTMLVNTEPIDFVISEILRVSRLCNAR